LENELEVTHLFDKRAVDIYQLAWIPAVLASDFQRSMSSAKNCFDCAGVSATGSRPCSLSHLRISSDCRMATISLLSFSTVAAGVLPGTYMPYQTDASKPGTPLSAMVGNSGQRSVRCAVVTASARIFPDSAYFLAVDSGSMTIC